MTAPVRGAEGVGAAVVDSLQARMPAALSDLAASLGPLDGLEDPKLYAPTDRFRVLPEEYPAVLVVPQSVPRVTGAAIGDDGDERLVFRYVERIYVFARGQGEETVAGYRNRLMLAVRVVVLRKRQLAAGLSIDSPVDGGVYRESYSATGQARDKRSVAAGWVEISVASVEGASIADLAVANTVATVLHPLPD